jgi:ATP-binding cassette subfamily G (WHITE) protein 2 (SNQ2)
MSIALITSLTFLNLGHSIEELPYRVFAIFIVTVVLAIIISQVEPTYNESGGLPSAEKCVSDFSPLEGLAAHFAFLPSSRRPASPRLYSTYVFSIAQLTAEMPYSALCATALVLLFCTSRRLSLSSMLYPLFLI